MVLRDGIIIDKLTEVEFTAEDVVQLDDSQSILQLITPFSCVSSSDFIENNFCEELYYDNYYGEGWVTADEICYKEYVTFDFKKSIYLEFMVIQNFEIDNLFQQYDKVKELNIIYSNNRVEPQLFQMEKQGGFSMDRLKPRNYQRFSRN